MGWPQSATVQGRRTCSDARASSEEWTSSPSWLPDSATDPSCSFFFFYTKARAPWSSAVADGHRLVAAAGDGARLRLKAPLDPEDVGELEGACARQRLVRATRARYARRAACPRHHAQLAMQPCNGTPCAPWARRQTTRTADAVV